MPWWAILLVVLFCDWSALAVLGHHLSKRAEKAVLLGAHEVQIQLHKELDVFLNPIRIIATRFGVNIPSTNSSDKEKVEQ